MIEIEIKINPAKFPALVKLGERLGLWKPEAGGDGAAQAQLIADENLRIENMLEVAKRFLPAPQKSSPR